MSAALPAGLAAEVEPALEIAAGRPVRIAGAEALHGGCVNPCA
jgi:hypothetical protein